MNLKISAWASIIFTIFVIPNAIFSFFNFAGGKESLTFGVFAFIIALASLVMSLLVLLGYLKLSKNQNLGFLKTMSYIMIVFVILIELTYIGRIVFNPTQAPEYLIIGGLFFSGLINLIFGISVIKLKNPLGGIASAAGAFRITFGVFSLLVLTYMILPFFNIVLGIIEAVLFFKASKLIQ
jgi:hypothetical protein